MTGTFWCALAAQVLFAAGLAVCVATVPSYVLGAAEGGVSNYGSDRRTVLPFTLSFGGNAALIAAAAASVPPTLRFATWWMASLSVLALLLSAVLVSAWVYKRGPRLRTFHFASGIAMLTYQSALALWLAVAIHPAWTSWTLWAVMLAADLVCVLALRKVFEKLFIGQVSSCIAFGVLLLVALAGAPGSPHPLR